MLPALLRHCSASPHCESSTRYLRWWCWEVEEAKREGAFSLYMGARPDSSPGDLVCCSGLRRLLTFVFFFLCACCFLMATAMDGASLGGSNNAAAAMATGSPAQHPGGSGRPVAGADAFRSSKRRIPKGPDPIHNRRAGKTTIEPRRRD